LKGLSAISGPKEILDGEHEIGLNEMMIKICQKPEDNSFAGGPRRKLVSTYRFWGAKGKMRRGCRSRWRSGASGGTHVSNVGEVDVCIGSREFGRIIEPGRGEIRVRVRGTWRRKPGVVFELIHNSKYPSDL